MQAFIFTVQDGETALFLAVHSADFHTSSFLVEEGACVNILNKVSHCFVITNVIHVLA